MRRHIILLTVLTLALGACSASDGSTQTTTAGQTTTTIGETPATTAETTTTTTKAPAAGGGSLAEPLNVGQVGMVGDWSVRVVSVTGDATELVLAENPFNEEPGEGELFFIANLEATYSGDESSTFWVDMSWKAVGASSVAYEGMGSLCGVIPDDISDAGETFPGGTITGNVCWKVASADFGSLVMIMEESFTFDNTRTIFSLDT